MNIISITPVINKGTILASDNAFFTSIFDVNNNLVLPIANRLDLEILIHNSNYFTGKLQIWFDYPPVGSTNLAPNQLCNQQSKGTTNGASVYDWATPTATNGWSVAAPSDDGGIAKFTVTIGSSSATTISFTEIISGNLSDTLSPTTLYLGWTDGSGNSHLQIAPMSMLKSQPASSKLSTSTPTVTLDDNFNGSIGFNYTIFGSSEAYLEWQVQNGRGNTWTMRQPIPITVDLSQPSFQYSGSIKFDTYFNLANGAIDFYLYVGGVKTGEFVSITPKGTLGSPVLISYSLSSVSKFSSTITPVTGDFMDTNNSADVTSDINASILVEWLILNLSPDQYCVLTGIVDDNGHNIAFKGSNQDRPHRYTTTIGDFAKSTTSRFPQLQIFDGSQQPTNVQDINGNSLTTIALGVSNSPIQAVNYGSEILLNYKNSSGQIVWLNFNPLTMEITAVSNDIATSTINNYITNSKLPPLLNVDSSGNLNLYYGDTEDGQTGNYYLAKTTYSSNAWGTPTSTSGSSVTLSKNTPITLQDGNILYLSGTSLEAITISGSSSTSSEFNGNGKLVSMASLPSYVSASYNGGVASGVSVDIWAFSSSPDENSSLVATNVSSALVCAPSNYDMGGGNNPLYAFPIGGLSYMYKINSPYLYFIENGIVPNLYTLYYCCTDINTGRMCINFAIPQSVFNDQIPYRNYSHIIFPTLSDNYTFVEFKGWLYLIEEFQGSIVVYNILNSQSEITYYLENGGYITYPRNFFNYAGYNVLLPSLGNGSSYNSISLCALNGLFYLAYVSSNNANISLFKSSDGENWTSIDMSDYNGNSYLASPNLYAVGQSLVMVFGTSDARTYIQSLNGGSTWNAISVFGNIPLSLAYPPHVAYSKNINTSASTKSGIFMIYTSSNNANLAISTDVNTQLNSPTITNPLLTDVDSSVSSVYFASTSLHYLVYKNTSGNLSLSTLQYLIGSTPIDISVNLASSPIAITSSPKLAVLNDTLIIVFTDEINQLNYIISTDGTTWSAPQLLNAYTNAFDVCVQFDRLCIGYLTADEAGNISNDSIFINDNNGEIN